MIMYVLVFSVTLTEQKFLAFRFFKEARMTCVLQKMLCYYSRCVLACVPHPVFGMRLWGHFDVTAPDFLDVFPNA